MHWIKTLFYLYVFTALGLIRGAAAPDDVFDYFMNFVSGIPRPRGLNFDENNLQAVKKLFSSAKPADLLSDPTKRGLVVKFIGHGNRYSRPNFLYAKNQSTGERAPCPLLIVLEIKPHERVLKKESPFLITKERFREFQEAFWDRYFVLLGEAC